MEIPLGKVLTTPPIANLGHRMETCWVKRRKLGDRVIRQFSPEITGVWCADVVYFAEGNMCVYRNGEISHGTTGLEVSHVAQ